MEMRSWTTPLSTCCFYSLQPSEEKLETPVLPYKANWGTSLGRWGCDSGRPAGELREGFCASVVQIFTHTHTHTHTCCTHRSSGLVWERRQDYFTHHTHTYKLYKSHLYLVNIFPLNSQNLDSLLQIGVWGMFIPTI